MHGFVSSLGARPVAIGPDAHDRLVAVTSHLPHVLANVLLNQAGSTRIDGHDPLHAAGGSLRDMTRIGGANPRIWVDIFLDNRDALAGALAEQRRQLEQVERALAAGDAGFLARWIGEASDAPAPRCSPTAFADPGDLQRLRVHISDRPGVLAGIFQALGAERINVEDFELDHVSTERGGTLTMLVVGRRRGRARRGAARGAGLRRRRRAGDRRMSAARPAPSSRPAARRPPRRARATSRSRTASVLIGAICDGETRVTGFGRSADTEATIAAVRALGVDVVRARRRHAPRVRRRASAGCARRGGRSTARTPARSSGCIAGILAGQDGQRFELDGRRVALAAADGADRRAARAGWARASRRRTAICR